MGRSLRSAPSRSACLCTRAAESRASRGSSATGRARRLPPPAVPRTLRPLPPPSGAAPPGAASPRRLAGACTTDLSLSLIHI
eukprot:4369732-Heterocapsa_arctica.AAC.1